MYKNFNNEDLEFFRMDNDNIGLKFKPYKVNKSAQYYINNVYEIINLCKQYPNKFDSSKIPDFTSFTSFREATDLQKSFLRRLDICIRNYLNMHIDISGMYMLLNSIANKSDDGKIIDMNDAINEMIDGISTSKVGVALCKHLLDEGYNDIFKNDKLNEHELNIYKYTLKVSTFCTVEYETERSKRDYSWDIEKFINNNLVNNNNIKNNLESVFKVIPDLRKNPYVKAFLYRIESTDHEREDFECLEIKRKHEEENLLCLLL